MDEQTQRLARAFGPVARTYDRGRPGYPDEAVAWLAGGEARVVLELGAGTGKLTEALVGAGHDVHATEPDEAMLAVLRQRLPEVRSSRSTAEEIPTADHSVDVVVAAQAFHWFDHAAAMPEIARVLRPGGHLALVWHTRDERIPWVKRLGRLIGGHENADSAAVLEGSSLFGPVESETFAYWQDVNRDTLVDLVASRSYIATLDEEARAAKLEEVRAFYDGFGRGYDGMQLPYVTHCFRSVVKDRLLPDASDSAPLEVQRVVSDGGDTDMLLIDFR